jgi:transposase
VIDLAVLLKSILYAYSRGITSSCKIRQAWRESIIFMALPADSQPHFTTIADSDRCWRSGSYHCCALY